MKPYQQVPILDCGEPLLPIPLDLFTVESPHPYVKLGAPYGEKSPYYLRQTVLQQLQEAQTKLQQNHPGWRIQIFDAYRPIAVQQFMVNYAFAEAIATQNIPPDQLTAAQQQAILSQVYQFWAAPSPDPATPPPHSTGAAIDVTLTDAAGHTVDMGSPIDEMSPRSYPDYFAPDSKFHLEIPELEAADIKTAESPLPDAVRTEFHKNRQILKQCMGAARFRQHPQEWWHFSLGDQLWAWLENQDNPERGAIAQYGAV